MWNTYASKTWLYNKGADTLSHACGHTHADTCAHMHTHMYTRAHTHTHARKHAHACTCTHTHTYNIICIMCILSISLNRTCTHQNWISPTSRHRRPTYRVRSRGQQNELECVEAKSVGIALTQILLHICMPNCSKMIYFTTWSCRLTHLISHWILLWGMLQVPSSEWAVESLEQKCTPRSPLPVQSHISSAVRSLPLRCFGKPGHDGWLLWTSETPAKYIAYVTAVLLWQCGICPFPIAYNICMYSRDSCEH